MNDRKWERYAALGGVVWVLCAIIPGVASGQSPATGDSADEIVKYLADNDTLFKLTFVLSLVGTLFLAWWFGSLWRRMSRAEGVQHRLAVVSLVGFTLSAAMALASQAIPAAVALRIHTDAASTAPSMYVLSTLLLAAAGFGAAVFLVATNALALRTKMLPTWIVAVGLLSAQ